MLTVTQLIGPDDIASLRDEWDTIDRSVFPRTPFTAALWHELWWKHFKKSSSMARDEFLVFALRDERGELVAIAPMMRTNRPSFGRLGIREIQFFGADPNITEIRGPICKPEMQGEVLRTLSDHFATRDKDWNWIRWHGIRRDLSGTFGEVARFRWTRSLPAYFLALPPTWQEFEKNLSSRVRKKLRSCYKYLERDHHVLEFRVVRDVTDVPQSLGTFYALHNARTHVRYFDVFSDQRAQAFFSEYATSIATRDQLRIFQVSFKGVVVATRLGFQYEQELYLYHSGNDPEWDEYSISTTLLAETMKWAITQGIKVLNLSTGSDRSKTRWNPTEIMYSDGVEVAPGLVSAQISRAYDFIRDQMHPASPTRMTLAKIRSTIGNSGKESKAQARALEPD
jgi:CelD/BcsL family acetyltransferase involved in cellulose biosynthesis